MSNAASYLRRKLSSEPSQEIEALIRRATCQIDFARAFVDAGLGGDASAVQQAQATFDAIDPAGGIIALKTGVDQIEATLAPISADAKAYTIHLVAHGHIDMNWMWSWPETVSATHDTFASVLSLMNQYPELTYSQSQASVYALIEKYHPSLFEEIKRRVKEGRWEVAAAHWVEGDKNIASGESLAHHLLYTRNYFLEKFDLKPEDVQVDWEPDTFGHANTIPSILSQGGVRYYYACRTGGGHHHSRHGEERPPVFWWQAPDGARVLVNRETTWYNSYVNIGENYAVPMVKFCQETGLKDWLDVYGIGNHGGGPTRVELDYFLESREWPCWPSVIFSTAQGWFRIAEAYIQENNLDIPVIDHELNYEFTGCYTSQSAIKKANRFGENYCVEAQTLDALRVKALAPNASNLKPNTSALREAWLNVLFNQFHDILPGSGVAATREHALGLFQETGAITGAVKQETLKFIAQNVNTVGLLPDTPEGREEKELATQDKVNAPYVAGAGHNAWFSGISTFAGGGKRFLPVVVYNPCSWARTEIVEAVLYDISISPDRLVATDETGTSYPTVAVLKEGQEWAWGHKSTRILFPAVEIPPLGYKTFLIHEGSADADFPTVNASANERYQTPHFKVQLDRYSAGILELETADGTDLSLHQNDFGNWWFSRELSRGMTSWVIGGFGEETALEASSCRVIGDVRNEGNDTPFGGSLAYVINRELKVKDTNSKIRLKTTVHSLAPRIDFEAEVDWREIGTQESGIPGLYIEFADFHSEGEDHRFETPFGSVLRPDEIEEVPTLRYASLGGGRVTVLQDSKYGHQIFNGAIRTRVVRSSFDPDHAPEVAKTKMRYSVYLHETPPTASELTRLGAAWNHPLIVVNATLQEGALPASQGFAEVKTPNVVLTGLKLAEDGNGLILRLVEHDGLDETVAEVELGEDLVKGYSKAEITDLMERPIGSALLAGTTLKVSIKANSFVTVRLS